MYIYDLLLGILADGVSHTYCRRKMGLGMLLFTCAAEPVRVSGDSCLTAFTA